jgi:hypothetical protein
VLCSGHEPVSAHVVKPVCVELARDYGGIYRARTASAHHVRYVVRETTPHLGAQERRHLAVADNHVAHSLVIGHLQLKAVPYLLKRVTEGTVSQIVHKRCGERLIRRAHPSRPSGAQ